MTTVAELTELVQTMLVQMQAQHQPPPAAAPPAAPAFLRNPGVAGLGGTTTTPLPVLDYSSSARQKLWVAAVAAADPKFDGKAANLRYFLSQVKTRGKEAGWDEILNIPVNNVTHNLLTKFGLISIEDVEMHVNTYINNMSRKTQASDQLCSFLLNSLDPIISMKLMQRENEYTVNGTESGALCLKVLISICTVETIATVNCILKRFDSLNEKFHEMEYNVTKLNEHVNDLRNQLTVRGRGDPDVMHKLFDAYETVADQKMMRFVETIRNNYESGSLPNMTMSMLMQKVEDKYKVFVETKQYKTTAVISDSKFMAMSAKVDSIAGTKQSSAPNVPRQHLEQATTSPGRKQRNERRLNTGDWAWKNVAPGPNDPKRKTFRGKEYVHCPFHPGTTQWVLAAGHADGCSLDPNHASNSTPAPTAPIAATTTTDITVNTALANLSNMDDYDENL